MWYSPKDLGFSTDGFYTTCGCAVFAVRVWSFVLQWMMMMMVIMIILIMLNSVLSVHMLIQQSSGQLQLLL
jgi:hypothetical protein